MAGSSLYDATPHGDGTCAASIAFGMAGVMIQGTLVSIKAFDDKDEFPISNFWDAFASAITDITQKPRRRGRSVININSKSIIYQMTFVHNNLHIII